MLSNFTARVWHSDELLAVVLAAVISLLGAIVVRIFTPRGNVAWGVSNEHVFNLQHLNPPTLVHTREVWIQNVGRALVNDLEVIINFPPGHYDIWPQRQFTQAVTPANNLVLKFDNLNAREHFTISLFQIGGRPPDINTLRWAGGVGKQRPMAPQQVWPRWVRILSAVFLLLGVFSLFYFIVRLAMWVAQ